jgi:hypothetical protein
VFGFFLKLYTAEEGFSMMSDGIDQGTADAAKILVSSTVRTVAGFGLSAALNNLIYIFGRKKIAITGAEGSGKTALLNVITGKTTFPDNQLPAGTSRSIERGVGSGKAYFTVPGQQGVVRNGALKEVAEVDVVGVIHLVCFGCISTFR